MSGTSGRTAVPEHLKGLPAPLVPPVELPAPIDELAVAAAKELGWPGIVLPEMRLLGRRICLVVELMTEAHAERICLGQLPVTDRESVATWVWPEFAGRVPEPAVRVVGAIAVARHWRTGLANVVPFLRYGDAAVVLPTSVVLTNDYLVNCLPRARGYGVAVVRTEPDATVDLDLPGRAERAHAGIDSTHRWISELAYDKVLSSATR
ncbi:MAG TPA: hypothetical protein VFV67_21170 [Actinophytocola sp.]|uniref:hypothetical protein n=1 Tax=Actinophytocola sp. TaxID=1872138 RepID=UPI002DBDCE7A|nr:hypothetical protein [Actinophytocola sp.]HEU5473164.1 hypothetical protein [Actinophytocola sp.]